MNNLDLLTNDAKYLLASMYKIYIKKRKAGSLKKDAISFGNSDEVHQHVMSEWQKEDVKSTCLELRKQGLITGTPASDAVFHIRISTEAIAIMESKFKDNVDLILDYAVKVKSLIPFI
ncbi:MAG: hypothetical protein ACTH8E_08675 [Brochothrix thermosphacta]|uniref:hypothetical protein n=1 Tax=Brochothrix thermosphacta TaxID=2756 RepID=UPI000A1A3606|nr:Phage protein [Brachybacterium faecium]